MDLELPNIDQLLVNVEDVVKEIWANKATDKLASYDVKKKTITLFEYDDLDYYPFILKLTEKQLEERGGFDDKIELADVFTKFVTTTMFGSAPERIRFLHLVMLCYRTMINTLTTIEPSLKKQVDIIFKGGTTIRLLCNQLATNLTPELYEEYKALTANTMRLSDFDFEIVSTQQLNAKTIVKINMVSYLVMTVMRNYITNHLSSFFNFFQKTKTMQNEIMLQVQDELQGLIQRLKGDNFFYGMTVDAIDYGVFRKQLTRPVKGRYNYIRLGKNTTCCNDFMILQDVDNNLADIGIVDSKTILKKLFKLRKKYVDLARDKATNFSRLYCSHNPNIRFEAEETKHSFALNRIKYTFTVYMTDKAGNKVKCDFPGEIFDLSHAHLENHNKYKYAVKSIQDVPFLDSYQVEGTPLSWRSYTLTGHIDDMTNIVFSQTNYNPWLDQKIKKRLTRILIAAIFNYFGQTDPKYSTKLNNLTRMYDSLKKMRGHPVMFSNNYELQLVYTSLAKTLSMRCVKICAKQRKVFHTELLTILSSIISLLERHYAATREPVLRLVNGSHITMEIFENN